MPNEPFGEQPKKGKNIAEKSHADRLPLFLTVRAGAAAAAAAAHRARMQSARATRQTDLLEFFLVKTNEKR